jgi:hypothetical protein
VTSANEFIRNTDGNNDPTIVRYNAEARFLRALAYSYDMDLFGNPPFTTEKDQVGNFFPKQLDENMVEGRKKLFNYITTELRSIENKLGAPKFSYPQADQAACWMLLARVYLNAEVYTGTEKYDSVIIYTNKVLGSNKYSLATNYRQNFSADNDATRNPEMIFSWNLDGVYTQGYVGTTFIIESSSDARYIRAEDFHGLTSNTNWNGNRARKQFMYTMLGDTTDVYGNNPIPWTVDTMFKQSPDTRIFCKVKKNVDIPSASSSGDYGIGIYKFTAKNADGSKAVNYNTAYASTDFPIFRLADAYMMRAEAKFRKNDKAGAVADINVVRQRAYGNTNGNITEGELTADFILAERGREFYYEAQRRTDLVRFGKFTDGGYNWAWKGGVYNGTNTAKKLNVFPIPGDEISSNPNIKQNPGY